MEQTCPPLRAVTRVSANADCEYIPIFRNKPHGNIVLARPWPRVNEGSAEIIYRWSSFGVFILRSARRHSERVRISHRSTVAERCPRLALYIYSRWTRRRAIEGNGKKLEDGDPTPQNGLPNARTESLTECTSFVCPDTRSRLSADDRIALFALFSYDPRVCIVHATNGHLFMPAVASVTTPLPARP